MVGVPMDENTPANEDDALKQINVKPRRFDGCDIFDEEQTSEVSAEADGLHRAIKGEFDARLLIPATHGC